MRRSVFATLLLSVAFSLGISSCSNDPKPNMSSFVLPDKISIEMHCGHLHGAEFHGNPSYLNIDFPDKGVQKIDFKINADGKSYSIAGGNNPVRWKSNVIWSMELTCYDKEGKRVNNMFVKEGAEDLFQLFITVDNIRKYSPGSKVEGPLVNTTFEKVGAKFVYRDTHPEDRMFGYSPPGENYEVKLSRKQLGLKGYFDDPETLEESNPFIGLRDKHLSYDLHLRMVRFATPGKKKSNGSYRSAYAWEEAFSALSVFELTIPIRVVTKRPSDDPKTLEEYLDDLAAEYEMSREEIEDLYKESWDVPIEGEGAEKYYM